MAEVYRRGGRPGSNGRAEFSRPPRPLPDDAGYGAPETTGMIITRSPLRISLGGGGTDLPSYYRRHSGFLVAAAVDRYVYITLHQTFVEELIVKYSKMERVRSVGEVQHPIVREALRMVNVEAPSL